MTTIQPRTTPALARTQVTPHGEVARTAAEPARDFAAERNRDVLDRSARPLSASTLSATSIAHQARPTGTGGVSRGLTARAPIHPAAKATATRLNQIATALANGSLPPSRLREAYQTVPHSQDPQYLAHLWSPAGTGSRAALLSAVERVSNAAPDAVVLQSDRVTLTARQSFLHTAIAYAQASRSPAQTQHYARAFVSEFPSHPLANWARGLTS